MRHIITNKINNNECKLVISKNSETHYVYYYKNKYNYFDSFRLDLLLELLNYLIIPTCRYIINFSIIKV